MWCWNELLVCEMSSMKCAWDHYFLRRAFRKFVSVSVLTCWFSVKHNPNMCWKWELWLKMSSMRCAQSFKKVCFWICFWPADSMKNQTGQNNPNVPADLGLWNNELHEITLICVASERWLIWAPLDVLEAHEMCVRAFREFLSASVFDLLTEAWRNGVAQ